MPEETPAKTLWVRLKGEDLERAILMKDKEKRQFSSLLRIALHEYYESHYSSNGTS